MLSLWENWHKSPKFAAPVRYETQASVSSETLAWLKQEDGRLAAVEQRDAERAARRQSVRAERDRQSLATAQQIAALQRATGVSTNSSAATPSAPTSASFDPKVCPPQYQQFRRSMADYHKYLDNPTTNADEAALGEASIHWRNANELDASSRKYWLGIYREQNYPEAVATYQKSRQESQVPKLQSSYLLNVHSLALRICFLEVALGKGQ